MSTATKPSLSLALRAACDQCHQAKVKCSGISTCNYCDKLGHLCIFSPGSRRGRPQGSPNKKRKKERTRRPLVNSSGASHDRFPSEASISSPELWAVESASDFSTTSHFFNEQDFLHENVASATSEEQATLSTDVSTWEALTVDAMTLSPISSAADPSIPSWGTIVEQGSISTGWTPQTEIYPHLDGSSPEQISPSCTNIIPGQSTSFFPTPNGHLSLSTSTSPAELPHTLPDPSCDCLIQLLDSLTNLKVMERSPLKHPRASALQALRKMLQDWESLQSCKRCDEDPDLDVLLIATQCLRSPLRMLKAANQGHAVAARYRWSLIPLDETVTEPVYYELTSEEQGDMIRDMTRRSLRHMHEVWRVLNSRCAKVLRRYTSGRRRSEECWYTDGSPESQEGQAYVEDGDSVAMEISQLRHMLESTQKLLVELFLEFG